MTHRIVLTMEPISRREFQKRALAASLAAALVQKASGMGGGVLCVYETDGKIRFRDHTSEDQPLAFAELPSRALAAHATFDGRARTADVRLQLDIVPDARGRFSITLTA